MNKARLWFYYFIGVIVITFFCHGLQYFFHLKDYTCGLITGSLIITYYNFIRENWDHDE